MRFAGCAPATPLASAVDFFARAFAPPPFLFDDQTRPSPEAISFIERPVETLSDSSSSSASPLPGRACSSLRLKSSQLALPFLPAGGPERTSIQRP
jgi:hypothetical protein